MTGWPSDEKKRLADMSPQSFPSREAALAWAVERGVFATAKAALPVYSRIKATGNPQDAPEMAALWVAHVNAVLLGERAANDTSHVDAASEDEPGASLASMPASEAGAASGPDLPPAESASEGQAESR